MDAKCRALIELGRLLQLRGYRFVAVAPSTHHRVLRREEASPSLEFVFEWSRTFFDREAIDGYLVSFWNRLMPSRLRQGGISPNSFRQH